MEEYTLPDLPYAYNALEPYIDEATMRLHHGKHHAAYVAGFNAALKKLEEARAKGDYASVQALSKAAAFHGSGHTMHALFWQVMCPASMSKAPSDGALFDAIARDYGLTDMSNKDGQSVMSQQRKKQAPQTQWTWWQRCPR